MADMKASVTLELIEKGFEKADKAAKSLDKLARSGKKAATARKGIDWGGDRSARSAERAARAEDRHARSIHRSTEAMRRQKVETLALERQQRRLEQAQRRGLLRAERGFGTHAAAGMGAGAMMSRAGMKAGAVGLSFLGGMGLGVGAGAGMIAAQTVKGAASDEWERDQLRVLGDISDAQMKIHSKTLDMTATRRGVGSQGAFGVFGGLMAGGLSDTDAAAMTDSVVVFAKATQAATEDAARSTVALRNNMGITADKMMTAYDAIALGGKAGQFEVQDMAKSLPSLLAKMSKLGEMGETGVRNTVAMAQAIRKTVGTSDEAATNFENMLDKFTSTDFVENAAKMGINVKKTMTEANKKGLSPAFAILQKIAKATKGDPFKIAELVPDRQAAAAITAVLRDMPFVLQLIRDMDNSSGTVMNDYATATDNASAAWDRFASNVSTKAKGLAEVVLPAVTAAMNAASEGMEGLDEVAEEKLKDASQTRKDGYASGQRHQKAVRFWAEKTFGLEPSDLTKDLHDAEFYDADKKAFVQNARQAAAAKDAAELQSRINSVIPAGRDFTAPAGGGAGIDKAMQDSGRRAEAAAKNTAGAIENILSSMDTYAAGLKAGNQFAAGLKASAPQAAAAANSVAGSVAGHFPQSPAKVGPLRKLPDMGRKISAQLAGGMTHDSPARAASRVAAGILKQSGSAAAAGQSSAGGKGSIMVNLGGVSIIGVSDPQAAVDYAGDAIRRKLDGVLGDVGYG
ncbi:hypothetical protein ASD64_07025 [Mesorhizobium sp. Root157]|uniref:phage tail tape measure protein n=1 Tax=Mesorhizobium sp. Root157 TaxID=1736477 RepID=UPI0006FEC9C7|nr:phage tail tape measure protein [Mesorhizobium sp. Root157]KQZ87187.1 hypothetical protein ASD64_07025 [Mesorhizobium sp. Root157]